ncbi:peptide-methionine (S)-S-oxide reductase MsrA [Kurthia huakuii]|uniref:peptide-methionine (S)-S-oxide reductase MsrA n=1 Tax=Kurthia huakuii TaxID=1421019 RepID=UPI000497A04C|nr:peptide-methionine (S)-S-oxide reductase MsrA [Kurthia huakuii]MBM7698102.1 peptide-methionine (S)-S-oxide reductase [Kurthia huakuii]
MNDSNRHLATFAGGCFWCMVKPFVEWDGIEAVISGYMGGTASTATYEQVKKGTTGHKEVVQITYDATLFSYEQLLELYWQQVDPTDDAGQFQDRGDNYRAMIFYHNEAQRQAAEQSKQALVNSKRFTQVVTPIVPAQAFYAAEDYHQDFYKKSPQHYHDDRAQSGRDDFIDAHWKK